MIWQPSASIWTPPLIGPLDIPLSPPATRRDKLRRDSDRDTRPLRNRHLCPGAWQEWAECVAPVARRRALAPSGSVANTLADAVFYYKFETTSWLDSTATGNNLTGSNSPTSNTGKLGNAIYVNGANQYASHTDATAYNMSGTNFTITAWVYGSSFPGFGRAVWKGDASTIDYGLYADGSNKASFLVKGTPSANASVATFGSAMSTTTWYFLEAYFDLSTGKANINMNNGTAVAASVNLLAALPVQHNATPFVVGRDDASNANYWDGRIDSVGGWKRLLTPTERTASYNGGIGADPF